MRLKPTSLLLVILLGALAGAQARELREFHSADKSKSFSGRLEGFDDASGVVTVRLANGAVSRIPLTALSQEDGEYIKSAGTGLQVGSKVDVQMVENSTRGEKESSGNFFITKVNSGYKINLTNRAPAELGGFEVRHRVYFAKAKAVVNPRTKKQEIEREIQFVEGTETVDAINAGQRKVLESQIAELSEMKQKPASQCTGGG
jgi:hypothetical protein